MPRHRINRPRGEVVKTFLEIGKAKQGVKQSAVARYLGVSEKKRLALESLTENGVFRTSPSFANTLRLPTKISSAW